MARATLTQHFDVTLSTPDASGNEVTLDAPLVWASSDESVYQVRNLSADGKSGQLKPVALNQRDPAGNEIPVRVSFTGDGDPSAGVKPLNAVTEDLFADAAAPGMADVITVSMSPPIDDAV